ncbi:helix-turn-helix domain-containing protein [uncultured Psychroserpens sp.]|uniref:helix-turn-helix domain-containing protein n=1 Tax=uncultured Psychroserpens sp. TaxID=255436 RepID=UPI0026017860|nr:helix-turn-helix domain-containing protein [uncultured Psychroserpens sp.]
MIVIKNIREQFGHTQAELAKQTGLSLRTIQRLESSNKEPKGHSLVVLSEVFNMMPSDLQEQFISVQQTKAAEKTSIQFINLSVLSFLGIPFGNIILPLVLWRQQRKSKHIDETGRRIINFQIIFSAVLSILLCLTPFIGRTFFSDTSIILYVLFVAYAINIGIVCYTALKLRRNNFNVLNIPLRFI